MRKQRGLSLIEILIALLILAAGVIALAKYQGDMVRNRAEVNQQNYAMELAQDKIENLRHYEVITTTAGKKAYDDIVNGTSSVVGVSATYTLTWTVTDNVSPPYKTVRVTVTWTDSTNTSRTITLDTVIGKVDPVTSGKATQALP